MRKLLFVALALLLMSFVPQKKERLWTAIGDSITYMNEHQDEAGNRITKGYMTMVTARLPGLKYINQGHNGWTSGGIAEHIEQLGLVKSDIYSVFLGTNDWWQGRPLGTIEDYRERRGNVTVYGSFRIIIDKLRSLNPQAQIILITPMQRVDFVYLRDARNNAWGSYKKKNGQSLEQFAQAIREIGRTEGLKVVDLYRERKLAMKHLVKYKWLKDPSNGTYRGYTYPDFIDVPFEPEKDEYPYPKESIAMTYDGLHPSDEGYQVITKLLIKAIGQ
ncbi:SGNH/GDSL hydrolase family protein [Pedobacter sp. JY14-1]|uniref:SGNH/GDSL hydrolase family protein n=1 Tax=Pedobacter sp. JY14-1 TaxID=3034151 RepID=UPI0023E0AFD8|nr:SGNH/GDSL hydrolase family protein [Pedobacter sp. JY14-1]